MNCCVYAGKNLKYYIVQIKWGLNKQSFVAVILFSFNLWALIHYPSSCSAHIVPSRQRHRSHLLCANYRGVVPISNPRDPVSLTIREIIRPMIGIPLVYSLLLPNIQWLFWSTIRLLVQLSVPPIATVTSWYGYLCHRPSFSVEVRR